MYAPHTHYQQPAEPFVFGYCVESQAGVCVLFNAALAGRLAASSAFFWAKITLVLSANATFESPPRQEYSQTRRQSIGATFATSEKRDW